MERESSGSFLAPKKNTPSASAIQMSCGPSIAFLLGDWLEHPPSRRPRLGRGTRGKCSDNHQANEQKKNHGTPRPHAHSIVPRRGGQAIATHGLALEVTPNERRAGSTTRG